MWKINSTVFVFFIHVFCCTLNQYYGLSLFFSPSQPKYLTRYYVCNWNVSSKLYSVYFFILICNNVHLKALHVLKRHFRQCMQKHIFKSLWCFLLQLFLTTEAFVTSLPAWLTWLISVCCWAPWLSFSSRCCSSCFLSTFNSACFTSSSVISLFNFATSSALSETSIWALCRDASAPVARACSSCTSNSLSLRLSWTSFLEAFSAPRCSSRSWYSFSLRASFSDRLCKYNRRQHQSVMRSMPRHLAFMVVKFFHKLNKTCEWQNKSKQKWLPCVTSWQWAGSYWKRLIMLQPLIKSQRNMNHLSFLN